MAEQQFFELALEGSLAVITYRRPPINMLSFQALGQLEKLLLSLKDQDELSVVVLTGGMKGYFAAHADVDDVMRMEKGQPPAGDPDAWDRVNALLGELPQLTVAAVNGQAWGGGCETALACDLLLLSEGGASALVGGVRRSDPWGRRHTTAAPADRCPPGPADADNHPRGTGTGGSRLGAG